MKDKYYPYVLRTDPPRVVTREEIDEYFRKRDTIVKILHLPATNPKDERGAQSGPE